MKVLVTGAAGRLGSCLCRMLADTKVEYVAVDKVPGSQSGFPVKVADLHDWEKCQELMEGMDVLVHLANFAHWGTESPERIYNGNVTMNMNVFQAAADAGCRRIIFSSSIQVLNGQLPTFDRWKHEVLLPYIPIDSDMPALPRNSYALSKLAAEDLLEYFSSSMGITCIAIRYPLLLDSLKLKEAVKKGGLERGNCYDGFAYLPFYSAAEVVMKAMTAKLDGYRNYFVASRDNLEQRSTKDIITAELAQLPCRYSGGELDSLVDCSRVEAELGWEQPKSLVESFQKCGSFNNVLPYE